MLHSFLCELAAFAAYFVYGSFFEWVFHRYLFHSPKYLYRLFREHTLVHHQIYKADESYHSNEDHPDKVPMDWWALPAMVLAHLPLFFFVQWLTKVPSVWGGVAALTTYYSLYESFHWAMHVPRASKFLSRFRVWRYLDAHHHVHHKYMLSNLNVILPLADLMIGTLRDGTGQKTTWQQMLRRKAATTPAAMTPTSMPTSMPTPVEPKTAAVTAIRQEAAWRRKKPTRV